MPNALTTETAAHLSNDCLYEIVQLDIRTIKARAKGHFEIANAYSNLAEALRSGALSLSRYLTSSKWGAAFGGRAVA